MMRVILSILVLFILSATVAQADTLVGFSPSKATLSPGETISVDIVMTDFPITEGGGLNLRFDPSVVEVTGVTVNTATWSFVNREGVIDNANGTVSDILFSRFPGISGDLSIATIEFKAIAKGNARLRLRESSRNPFASDGDTIRVEFKSGVLLVKSSKVKSSKVKGGGKERRKGSSHKKEHK